MRATWFQRGLALSVMLVTVAACGAAPGAAQSGTSPGSSRPESKAPREPVAASAFAGLVLSHPASWVQFFLSPSASLDPRAAGYLTNEPIPAACRGASPATVVCGQPVRRMSRGGVYITVAVLYQPPGPLPQANRTIAGYPADVVTGPDPGTYGCPAGTTRTLAATLSRADVQPSQVLIFACFVGPSIGRTQQQVLSMLNSARITARPAATEPVPGAPMCTSQDLVVAAGPPLSLMTQEEGVGYAVHNIGPGTCRISGYPRVQLSAKTTSLPFDYQDGGGPFLRPGRPPALYLRPGVYASFQIDTSACTTAAGTAATTVKITLPGQTTVTSLPARARTGLSRLSYCEQPGQTVYISALSAY